MVGGSLEDKLSGKEIELQRCKDSLQEKEMELQRCLRARGSDSEGLGAGALESLPPEQVVTGYEAWEDPQQTEFTPIGDDSRGPYVSGDSDTGLGGIAGGDGLTSASSTDETENIQQLVQLLDIDPETAELLLITAEGNIQQAINDFYSSQGYGSQPNLHESGRGGTLPLGWEQMAQIVENSPPMDGGPALATFAGAAEAARDEEEASVYPAPGPPDGELFDLYSDHGESSDTTERGMGA